MCEYFYETRFSFGRVYLYIQARPQFSYKKLSTAGGEIFTPTWGLLRHQSPASSPATRQRLSPAPPPPSRCCQTSSRCRYIYLLFASLARLLLLNLRCTLSNTLNDRFRIQRAIRFEKADRLCVFRTLVCVVFFAHWSPPFQCELPLASLIQQAKKVRDPRPSACPVQQRRTPMRGLSNISLSTCFLAAYPSALSPLFSFPLTLVSQKISLAVSQGSFV